MVENVLRALKTKIKVKKQERLSAGEKPSMTKKSPQLCAMTTKVTRYAPKLSLRGETYVSTRQSSVPWPPLFYNNPFNLLILIKNLPNLRMVESALRARQKETGHITLEKRKNEYRSGHRKHRLTFVTNALPR